MNVFELKNILVPLEMLGAIVIVVIAILNYSLKAKILKSGYKEEEYIKLLRTAFEYRSSALKWGILLLFAGIGLVIIAYLPDQASFSFGVEVIVIGLGFITYYLIARKENL
jgi:hypothetical protein